VLKTVQKKSNERTALRNVRARKIKQSVWKNLREVRDRNSRGRSDCSLKVQVGKREVLKEVTHVTLPGPCLQITCKGSNTAVNTVYTQCNNTAVNTVCTQCNNTVVNTDCAIPFLQILVKTNRYKTSTTEDRFSLSLIQSRKATRIACIDNMWQNYCLTKADETNDRKESALPMEHAYSLNTMLQKT
jgi:hypothetical protein